MQWLVKQQVIYTFNGKNKIIIDRKNWIKNSSIYRIKIYIRKKFLWFNYWVKKYHLTFQTTDKNTAIEKAIELVSNKK